MYKVSIFYRVGFLNSYAKELHKDFETKKAANLFAQDFRKNFNPSGWPKCHIEKINIIKI